MAGGKYNFRKLLEILGSNPAPATSPRIISLQSVALKSELAAAKAEKSAMTAELKTETTVQNPLIVLKGDLKADIAQSIVIKLAVR